MQHKLGLFTNEQTLLVAANGKRMPVMGTTTLTAGVNEVTRKIHTLVLPAITEDMLVSCNNLINLEITPRNFPNVRIQNCKSIKELKHILIAEFPGILSNELNPEPMKASRCYPEPRQRKSYLPDVYHRDTKR